MRKRKSKEQLERERQEKLARWNAKQDARLEKERVKEQRAAQKRREAAHRAWLAKERSKPRTELPSKYAGDSIYVHKKIYDGFMKQLGKKIDIVSMGAGAPGGCLVIEYTIRSGGNGVLELKDLGPMPVE